MTDENQEMPVIRRLRETDSLAELTEMLHRAYAGLAAAGMRYLASHQTETVTATRVSSGECYVALCGGRLVGTITLVPPGGGRGAAYYQRPGVAAFQQFGVEPELQGTGIGSRLLETVEARAQELGAVEMALDTAECATQLIAAYERRGYRIVDRVDWEVTNYVSVVMAKPLGSASDEVRSANDRGRTSSI
jgi:GNAT superfamily N-acetyltransferase